MAIDGNWNIVIQTPMGPRDASLSFEGGAAGLAGTFSNARGSGPIYDASADGDGFAFSADFDSAMGKMKLDFKGTREGDAVSGDVVFGTFGNGTFSGSRA